MTVAKLIVLLTAVALAATGQLILKRGMNEVQEATRRSGQHLLVAAVQSPWVLGGLVVFAASAVAWLMTLAHVPLSVAYPFNAAGYVGILAVSSLVLHERTTVWTWVGTLLVSTGLVLVVLTAPRSASHPARQHGHAESATQSAAQVPGERNVPWPGSTTPRHRRAR